MRFSIRLQLLLPLLALMLGLVAASTWSAWSSGQRARRQIEKQIDDIATTAGDATFPVNRQILHLMRGLSGADFLLCDESRRPIADAGGLVSTLTEAPSDLPAPSDPPTKHFDRPVKMGGASYLCGGVARSPSGRPPEILYVFYPESLWQEAAWEALRPALAIGIIGALISIFLSVLATQMLSRRILDLERRTRLIAAGDFSPMPLPSLNDELRDLGGSINDMAQRLAQFQETIRQTERLRLLGQVSGGLAHQLRNGVTGARLAVQLHAKECALDADDSLEVALRQLSLVEMHLKRFLDLGKSLELQTQPCRLAKALEAATALVVPQCRHAHIDLRVVPPQSGDVTVMVDPQQFGQVFLNVLTNAIEAAGPNGWVEVRWGTASDRLGFVEIRDSGAGPPPEIADRLFEPFVTGKREGVGLGLAVARQVAEAHGGTLNWKREANCTCFRIELPRAS